MSIDTSPPLLPHRRTKIVATIGPASNNAPTIEAMIRKGASVFRLNFSHGAAEEHRRTYELIRQVSMSLQTPVAILADLCGPKIRTGVFENGGINLAAGEKVTVTVRDVNGCEGLIPCIYKNLTSDLEAGSKILMDDGLIQLNVLEKLSETDVSCMVVDGGYLKNSKGMNLPGVNVSSPALTDKDRGDAELAINLGVDFLALSFVRHARDIQDLREIIEGCQADTRIVAKIEKPEALEDIESILAATDGIMIARGDLGVELLAEQVPIVQDRLCAEAKAQNKPVIVATQMLESMMQNPRPTRAEVSDVSHAVSIGTDAIMLSGETAVGNHPVQAVEMMDRIARQTEALQWQQGAFGQKYPIKKTPPIPITDAVARATSQLSRDLRVQAIVAPSRTGTNATVMSSARPAALILAISSNCRVVQRMNLSWGVLPRHMTDAEVDDSPELARDQVKKHGLAKEGDNILLVHGFNRDPAENHPSVTVLQV